MIIVAEGDLRELITTGSNRKYKDIVRNAKLFDGLMRAVKIMANAESLDEMKKYSFLHYEQLRYQYSGLSSVRLSNSYVHRLIFEEKEDKITLKLIEIDDTHYGNKK